MIKILCQGLENSVLELQSKQTNLTIELDNVCKQKDELENTLKLEIEKLETENARLENLKETETKVLLGKIESITLDKETTVNEAQDTIEKLKAQITDLEEKAQEKDTLVVAISEKDKEIQVRLTRVVRCCRCNIDVSNRDGAGIRLLYNS